jgi:hypothetical protein
VPPSILLIPLYAQIRTLGLADGLGRAHRRLPVVHGAVRHVAPDGLLRPDPEGSLHLHHGRLPVLRVYTYLQRYRVEGLTAGSVKG